jgi:competence protein ComEC
VLFARLRHAGAEQLQRGLRPDVARVARALILGEQSELERKQFNAYLHTGLFHILAISGQHVIILCGLLWLILRALHVPRRIQALVMLALVLSYCLLTGARPPMVRAASVVSSLCVGMMLARRSQPLNSLALAWIATIVINPTDIFQTGCQISYLGVLLLFQILAPLRRAVLDAQDPLQQLIAQSRPLWQCVLLQAGSWVWWTLLANLLLTLAFTPLLATRYHIISPIAVPLGPPLIFLTAVALVLGFIYLALAPVAPWLVGILGWSIEQLLSLCAILVEWGATLPLSFWHAAGLPEWTLWLLYVPMIAFLIFPPLHRYWKCLIAGAMCWLVLTLLTQVQRPIDPGLRCTVLSVGHGSCVVLELPDGRVLLYDAGSLPGPDVTTKKIAPFLWHRGISRIDEVLVSHADLDHFNGLPSLVDRFRVGQVTWTPTFAERPEPAVRVVTQALEDRGIRTRVVNRGERLTATDVDLHVLHPPPRGPAGKENARSLVLLISYAGRTLLLTGDLEEPGLSEVTAMPPPKVDVLLAPHHGSRFSNTEAFAVWCKPGLVVSSEGRPRGPRADPFTPLGATVWRTWHDGAATIIMDEQGVRAESFRTNKHWAR